jgi:hypothetical protein
MKRVRTIFSGVQGTPYFSNLYFGDSALSNACVTVVSTFFADMDGVISQNLSWTTQGTVVTIDPVTGDITDSEDVTGQNGVGADTGELMPFATQALIRWHTGEYINGRELRGRCFIPGMTIVADDQGVLLPSTLLTIQNAADGLIAAGQNMLLWSKTHGQTRAVTSADVWEQFAVLRSRRD